MHPRILRCIPKEELTRANSTPKGNPRDRRTFQFTWKGKGKTREGEKKRRSNNLLLTSTWKSLRPKGAELAETG